MKLIDFGEYVDFEEIKDEESTQKESYQIVDAEVIHKTQRIIREILPEDKDIFSESDRTFSKAYMKFKF